MKLTVKDMIEYGYTWIGMIPLTEEEVLSGETKDKTVYVLYPNGVEAKVDTMIPYIGKGFIFGIERGIKDTDLIASAIEVLRKMNKTMEDPECHKDSCMIAYNNRKEILLYRFGFTDEDIDAAVKSASLI